MPRLCGKDACGSQGSPGMRWAHRGWERAVEALVDGETPHTGWADMVGGAGVHDHLSACPDCTRHVNMLLAVRASLLRNATRLPTLSPERRGRLEALLRSEPPPVTGPS